LVYNPRRADPSVPCYPPRHRQQDRPEIDLQSGLKTGPKTGQKQGQKRPEIYPPRGSYPRHFYGTGSPNTGRAFLARLDFGDATTTRREM